MLFRSVRLSRFRARTQFDSRKNPVIFTCMKQLLSDGAGGYFTFILPSQRFAPRRRFDPWPSHSYGSLLIGSRPALSNTYYSYAIFALNSGLTFYYIGQKLGDVNAANAFDAAVANFQVKDYPGNWMGEGFNMLQRPGLVNKFTFTQLLAWYAVH
jgi:hypothetical protein